MIEAEILAQAMHPEGPQKQWGPRPWSTMGTLGKVEATREAGVVIEELEKLGYEIRLISFDRPVLRPVS